MIVCLWQRRLRRVRNEAGFTIVELTVVCAYIAILIAIAIPQYKQGLAVSRDRAAQSAIRSAYSTERLTFLEDGVYTTDSTKLAGLEAAYTWANSTTFSTTGTMYVATGATQFYMGNKSASGTCYYLRHTFSPATSSSIAYARDTACGAADTRTYSATGWRA